MSSTYLQGELWPLRAPLQGLLGVVELRRHWVPLLGEPVRGHKVREALQRTTVFEMWTAEGTQRRFSGRYLLVCLPVAQETEEIH